MDSSYSLADDYSDLEDFDLESQFGKGDQQIDAPVTPRQGVTPLRHPTGRSDIIVTPIRHSTGYPPQVKRRRPMYEPNYKLYILVKCKVLAMVKSVS